MMAVNIEVLGFNYFGMPLYLDVELTRSWLVADTTIYEAFIS